MGSISDMLVSSSSLSKVLSIGGSGGLTIGGSGFLEMHGMFKSLSNTNYKKSKTCLTMIFILRVDASNSRIWKKITFLGYQLVNYPLKKGLIDFNFLHAC